MARMNEYGQPIGDEVPGWTERPWPPRTALPGRYVRLEPLDVARHAPDLDRANRLAPDDRAWTYLSVGPFATFEAYRAWLDYAASAKDPLFHAIIDLATGRAVGLAAYMRIDPKGGAIEVGHINFSNQLQRTRGATEAMYLMMARAFDELGYRRYEWKCDALNAPSRAAAERLGFRFEGIFRQALVYKGRSRDTAWFSILDTEWPALKAAFETWLAPENFDQAGRQKRSLSALTAPPALPAR